MKTIDKTVRLESPVDMWLDRIISIGVLLFLGLLPFHLVIKQLVPGVVGTYWKEALLLLLVLLWGVRCIVARKLLLTGTIIDAPVILYVAIIFLHLLVDRSGLVAVWGAYISILYLPLFFLIPLTLRRYTNLMNPMILGLVGIGAFLSLGAITEFLVNKSLWPSIELTMRQGFPDVYVYGTHLRRVYFIFDSPTTLANTLAMIFPLAVLVIIQSKNLLKRIISSAAAVFIFTAIVLTFSRGIWVALALTLGLVILIKLISERNWKFLIIAAGASLAGLLILVGIWLLTPVAESTVESYSLELTPTAYASVALGQDTISLMDMIPLQSTPEKQVWMIYDPIEQQNDERQVLYTPPISDAPMELVFPLTVPDRGLLRFSIAVSPHVWTPDKGDGVKFEIYIRENSTENGQFVFNRYINPKVNTSDRRWRNYVVDLSAWSGKDVFLSLITDAGPQGDYGFDWSGWGELELGTANEGFVASNWPAPKNPVAAHIASITDWQKDESNRDRTAAWNSGFSAWADSPIWGNGLGTTGAAALRSMPQQAIVPESQPLKMAIEMGIPGLLVWAFLWFGIVRTAINLYLNEANLSKKYLILGIMSSLMIVFIDGLVYQNLEAKQVNAYFWALVGILAFLQSTRIDGKTWREVDSENR